MKSIHHIPEIEEIEERKEKLREEFRNLPISNQIIWDSMDYVQQETMREQFEIIADWWLDRLDSYAQEKIGQIFNEEEHRNEGKIKVRGEDGVGLVDKETI